MRKVSTRKSRRGSRKGPRRVRWTGGGHHVVPAGVNDTSMTGSSRLSLAQGGDYAVLHKGQHGGFIAPVGDTGMLDAGLRDIARVGVLDQSMTGIQGMQDGGGKRNHKRILALLKKLTRKQRGGMPYALTQAQDYSSPGMLLSPSAERAALGSMNPEWRLAADPTSFAPNMRGGATATVAEDAARSAGMASAARAALAARATVAEDAARSAGMASAARAALAASAATARAPEVARAALAVAGIPTPTDKATLTAVATLFKNAVSDTKVLEPAVKLIISSTTAAEAAEAAKNVANLAQSLVAGNYDGWTARPNMPVRDAISIIPGSNGLAKIDLVRNNLYSSYENLLFTGDTLKYLRTILNIYIKVSDSIRPVPTNFQEKQDILSTAFNNKINEIETQFNVDRMNVETQKTSLTDTVSQVTGGKSAAGMQVTAAGMIGAISNLFDPLLPIVKTMTKLPATTGKSPASGTSTFTSSPASGTSTFTSSLAPLSTLSQTKSSTPLTAEAAEAARLRAELAAQTAAVESMRKDMAATEAATAAKLRAMDAGLSSLVQPVSTISALAPAVQATIAQLVSQLREKTKAESLMPAADRARGGGRRKVRSTYRRRR